jgi:cytochrome c-type biogenesis protein CcmH/NrfF
VTALTALLGALVWVLWPVPVFALALAVDGLHRLYWRARSRPVVAAAERAQRAAAGERSVQ